MSSYSYVEQGEYKLLVYKKNPEDQIDSMVIGQLANTSSVISGVLPIVQSEINGEIQFQVNVTGKISLRDFFVNPVSPKQLLSIYKQIAVTLKEASDYMLGPEVFVLDNQYVYISLDDEKVSLVALPVIQKFQPLEEYFRKLLFQDYDQTEDKKLITDMMSVFNSMAYFSIDEFLEKMNAISVPENVKKKDFVKNNNLECAKQNSSENDTSKNERNQRSRAQEVVYAGNNFQRSKMNEGEIRHKNQNEQREEEISEKKDFVEESKGLFGPLFGKKKKKIKKENTKKEKKNKKVSSSSGHSFAIPGIDEENANRKNNEDYANASNSNNGIRAQKINMSNIYRNEKRNFGETEINDQTSMEETDKTEIEENIPTETMIHLRLINNRGYRVPDLIQLKLIDGYVIVGRYDKTGIACADFNFDYSLTFISKEHIKIYQTDEGFKLVDMNSTNGTLLNGKQLTAGISYALRSGDLIEFSRKTKLAYVMD